MSSTSYFTTAIGWTVVVGAAGAIWAYNNTKSKSKSKPQAVAKQATKVVEDRKVPKSKKSKKDGGLSSGDQDKKSTAKTQKKKAPTQNTEPKQETVKAVNNDSDKDDDEAENNRKFALQFAKTQAGTSFSGKSSTTANRQKSVKQSRAQEKAMKDSGNITAGDADDDQSFTDSPEVGPTSVTSPVASGIADMLEPAAPGPSVLKVTESTKPAKKEKVKAAPQPVETKKQRQNRAKVEAARQVREAEEKERKVKEEIQRRTAREAEGRAAKDGSQFMASQKSADSAWTASSAAKGSNTSAANNGKVDLLDTIEDKTNKKVKVAAPADNFSESEVVGSEWQGYGDDDERVKTAIEDSREWEQVSNKKKRAKKEKKENNGAEGAGTTSSTDEKEYTVPPKTERSGPGAKWVSELTHVDKDGNVHEKTVELQDSEWEVS